ncbi:hypothetical protein BJP34_35690 (plasmid) [Moorena producens PAL-8-15-08-1]|uniref:Uncharacterized protein n=1 Tax=Moorena producens PAL-8-15-08-1 TaxID=1458985 RepID=A0A1D8U4N6_9CYAN|nr:hypothetical protein [Moorena producens]AOX04724.1 hypothetical protein BJP34_35690 [Moorena producens PAL-8-15-08-1]
MSKQNSTPEGAIRPETLMSELNIKKDAYYKDLNHLKIEAQTDSEGKAYLTQEEADQVRALRSHVKKTGKRSGFSNNSIVKVDDSNLAKENEATTSEIEGDVYVQPENPTDQFDPNDLIRSAAELKAYEMAVPDLVKRALADKMDWDDLPEDLQQKVSDAKKAANPKYTPASIADTVLVQHRSGN